VRVATFVLACGCGLAVRGQAQSSPSGVRLDEGRFTVVADRRDDRLARTLLREALTSDSFPGLPRPRARVLIAIAPDAARFREWIGPNAPEWGAAIAMPDEQRIVMQGSRSASDAGDPRVVLRHELAHLALHEFMGGLPPRWFDEGYASVAAREWDRDAAFETSIGLVWHVLPSRDLLDRGFSGGASQASFSYAIAHRVVAELEALDPANGLRNFFRSWKDTGSLEVGIRTAYGMTGAQFDRHWQGQLRRRYGALSLVASLALVAGLFGVLLGPLFVMRRRRDKRRLEVMRAADAASEAALHASALAALLAPSDPSEAGDSSVPPLYRPGGDGYSPV